MKSILYILLLCLPLQLSAQPTARQILERIDKNMSSENRVFTSKMIIHGRRGDRSIEAKSYSVGDDKAFTEYLSPAREKGSKMLKLDDQLWIYNPSSDRTILIAGHMLRQSVMGSDLSYEDMMEDNSLIDNYEAVISGTEALDGSTCWVLDLTALTEDLAYQKRRMWVDQEKYVPLKEELFAKSGKLLKRTTLSDVQQIQGRWFPMRILFKDMLKQGDGTEYVFLEVQFNQDIPEYLFTKASLR